MNTEQLIVHMFPCLSDNYGYLIHDAKHNLTAAIDTPDAAEIQRQLDIREWKLTHILNTHHHPDHAGGNNRLKADSGCQVIGPRADEARIPGIDVLVGDGDEFLFGQHTVTVYDTPGHTRGHIVYHFADQNIAFVGDTLFALGCGRLFEGTPDQMWQSLQKILAWDDQTLIYCAHEYTQDNARFCADRGTTESQIEKARGRNRPLTCAGLTDSTVYAGPGARNQSLFAARQQGPATDNRSVRWFVG